MPYQIPLSTASCASHLKRMFGREWDELSVGQRVHMLIHRKRHIPDGFRIKLESRSRKGTHIGHRHRIDMQKLVPMLLQVFMKLGHVLPSKNVPKRPAIFC